MTTELIGKRVKIKCWAFYKGRIFYGIVKSIKTQSIHYTTVMVLIDNHKKATAFATNWLTVIE